MRALEELGRAQAEAATQAAGGGLTLTLPVVFVGVALILFGIYGWALQPLEH